MTTHQDKMDEVPDLTVLPKWRQIRVPASPHMPGEAIAFLEEKLRSAKCYLEYGAGGSTRLAVNLRIPHIFSVESDPDFAKAVRQAVSKDIHDCYVWIRTSDIGKITKWGYPEDDTSFKKWHEYPTLVWNVMQRRGVSPDVILIDGRFRVACFFACLISSKAGTIVLFDDYIGRERRYKIVEQILKPAKIIGRMAVFYVPGNLPLSDIAMGLAKYSVIPD